MQRVQTDDRPEQGGDHAPNGAFNDLRVFFLFYSDNTLEGREGGENLRMMDVDLAFILHCKLYTHTHPYSNSIT